MKKITAIILALSLSLCFAGCSENGDSSSKADSSSGASSVVDSEVKDSSQADEDDKSSVSDSELPTDDGEIVFTELTVVDNDECTIKITGLDPEGVYGYDVKAEFVNKSTDKNYMFSVATAHVNNLFSDPHYATKVEPGTTQNEDIYFDDHELEEIGYDNFTDIEITFRVYDYDDWSADDVAYETVHIYPYGEDKATVFERKPLDTDKVLVDNDYAKITYVKAVNDEYLGYTVTLFIENKSDMDIATILSHALVNGKECEPYFTYEVKAGKMSYAYLGWFTTSFEEAGIDTVEKIEGTFYIVDSKDYFGDSLASDSITLEP